jgi:hypothetical protein
MDAILDVLLDYANLIEAGFWILVGACFFGSMLRPSIHRAPQLVAAVNFVFFGLSDIVEYHTGAWWRPWWLLAWKVICVAIMLTQLFLYSRKRRKR